MLEGAIRRRIRDCLKVFGSKRTRFRVFSLERFLFFGRNRATSSYFVGDSRENKVKIQRFFWLSLKSNLLYIDCFLEEEIERLLYLLVGAKENKAKIQKKNCIRFKGLRAEFALWKKKSGKIRRFLVRF